MFSNFPPLHPAIVHFPIALFFLAGLFSGISLFFNREFWKDLAIKSLIIGVIFTPLAVLTGMIEEQNLKHNEGVHEILVIHKYNGIAILFYFQILLVWIWLRRKLIGSKEYIAWVFSLLLGNLSVVYQGYLGGEMVFNKGAGVKPMESLMETQPGHGHGGAKMEMNDSSKMKNKHDEGGKHDEDSMKGKDMKSMEPMKDSKDMKNMKDMPGVKNMKGMKDMPGMKNMKGMDDMKGMQDTSAMANRKDMNNMKDMDKMKNMPRMDSTMKMGKMENMKMPEKNAMDTIRFRDNNPGLKKSKSPVNQ